jgi:hypothetical protein
MPDYLIHKSKTGIANTAEWQETDMHQLQNQAAGDILYAADGTHLTRLAKQTDGNVLVLASGVPAWGEYSHQTRHKWGGADQIDIIKLWLTSPNQQINSYDSNFVATLTGTGYGWGAGVTMGLATGATSGSTCGRVTGAIGAWHQSVSSFRYVTWFRLLPITVTTQMEFWGGWFSDTGTFPTTISNHYAIKMVSTSGSSAVVSASNGAGATETATQLLASIASQATLDVLLIYDTAGGNIKYYYSSDLGATWTLGATHTTNMPDNCNLYVGGWIKNSSGADRRVDMTYIKLANGVN